MNLVDDESIRLMRGRKTAIAIFVCAACLIIWPLVISYFIAPLEKADTYGLIIAGIFGVGAFLLYGLTSESGRLDFGCFTFLAGGLANAGLTAAALSLLKSRIGINTLIFCGIALVFCFVYCALRFLTGRRHVLLGLLLCAFGFAGIVAGATIWITRVPADGVFILISSILLLPVFINGTFMQPDYDNIGRLSFSQNILVLAVVACFALFNGGCDGCDCDDCCSGTGREPRQSRSARRAERQEVKANKKNRPRT